MKATDDLIAADVARAAAVAEGLFQRCYTEDENNEEQDIRLETVMVVSVLVWTDDEGDERESVVIGAETKRRHIQEGILHGALRRFEELYDTSSPWSEEDE